MVKLNKDENEKEFILNCDGCGHGFIRITYWPKDEKWTGDYDTYLLDYAEMVFYTKQDGILKTIWNRIKLATNILIGKEYSLYELVLYAEQFKEFLNFVNKNTGSVINGTNDVKEVLDKN